MTLGALLQLCRIPNVFTAFANVVAGVLLVRSGEFRLTDVRLVLASGLLYIAGMVLNDFFDRRVDAVERPERPIPSGQVRPATAALLGLGLLGAGLVCAAATAESLVVALLLSLAIVGYDAGLKATPFGPFAMGTCRALNFLLGMSVGWWHGAWLALAPLSLGLLTAAITVLSRDEVAGGGIQGTRRVVLWLWLFAGLVVIAQFVVAVASAGLAGVAGWAPFAALVCWRGRRVFAPLWYEASAPALGRAIGGGILLMPLLDASWVAAAGTPVGAAAVAAFVLPAIVLKRWYYST
jgi:4-hydroxybenzoate polyprenyltransferase